MADFTFSLKRSSDSVLDGEIVESEFKAVLTQFATIAKSFNVKTIAVGNFSQMNLNHKTIFIKSFKFKTSEENAIPTEEDVAIIDKLLKSCLELLETRFSSYNFEILDPEEENKKKIKANVSAISRLSIDKKGNHFDHIFDREDQIKIVLSAVETAIQSNFDYRFHCVLYGEPACGKTEILDSLARMLGEEGDAYIKLDATSTTKAGVEKMLLDTNSKIPNILIVEELEKANEDNFRWMLGLLDSRSEIRKTTATDSLSRKLKMLCLATVNNLDLFKKRMAGALYSRFSNKIYCPRPTKEVLRKILLREVEKFKGNPDWIDPAIDFCTNKLKINDPREIIPICLCGKDDLLDGSYQESLLKTRNLSSKAA